MDRHMEEESSRGVVNEEMRFMVQKEANNGGDQQDGEDDSAAIEVQGHLGRQEVEDKGKQLRDCEMEGTGAVWDGSDQVQPAQ